MVPITFGMLVPLTIVWRSHDAAFWQDTKAGHTVLKIIGAIVWIIGVSVLFASNVSFHKQGKGTLEPWERPKQLVTSGLYRYVRNSMYLGVFTMLLGELLFFNNKNLLLYLFFFMIAQSINVPLHEERVLRKSFGPEFEEYCKHVPRWIPRLHPYTPHKGTD
ncbi:probable PEMT/PEM2 methyltransferase family protein at C-terminar half [Coccomyxa sp. Obi]|nr:probable PEMT/PEM2 methyltransferase family protein at C-terminar half [Coccomyxa sp. Obi]